MTFLRSILPRLKARSRIIVRDLKTRFKQDNVIILDDIFPHLLSGFRIAEFNYYLQNIPGVRVFSTGAAFKWLCDFRSFDEVCREYGQYYPDNLHRVEQYSPRRINSKLVYVVFLSNTHAFLPLINKYRCPFVFTLYPGGGFRLNQEKSDQMLKDVFASPFFRKVIVTSTVTRDYLLKNRFCREDQIVFVYGVVTQVASANTESTLKNHYPVSKNTFDICFVAHRYTSRGADKGYDVFIEVARKLVARYSDINFHVVGNFNENDIDIKDLAGRVTLHGPLKTKELSTFYRNMDVILSPNRSFALDKGAFDGFPTGACIEAGINEVALFVADDLQQNNAFKNGEEIEIITTDSDMVADKLEHYYKRPDLLYALAKKGRYAIEKVYNLDTQMKPRMNVLTALLDKNR